MATLAKAFASHLPWVSAPFIVGAPMRIASGHKLAVAVSSAGGLGFIGPGAKTQDMKPNLDAARDLLSRDASLAAYYKPNNKKQATMPLGVGFQLWNDDLDTAADLIRHYQPRVAWLYAPKDEKQDFARWSSKIRASSPGIQIWIQIGTVAEVRNLIQMSDPPDVIIAQGAEAGGHGRAKDGVGLVTIVPEVTQFLNKQKLDIPVVAAGGITDGRGMAASLCLGASAVAIGTRFLASTEANISRGYQEEIIRASDGGVSTTRTLLYNHLRGTYGWPEPYQPRTIINRSYIDQQSGVSFERLQELHDEAAKQGDKGWGPEGRLATYAGASVGLIDGVKSAGEIVQNIQHETRSILSNIVNQLK